MNKHTCNFHCQLWSVVRSRRDILDLAQCEHAVDDFAKDDVFPVEEITRCSRDEELQSQVEKDEQATLKKRTHLAAVRDGTRVGLFSMSLLQRQGYVTVWLTIDSSPGPVCFTWKFSSYKRT